MPSFLYGYVGVEEKSPQEKSFKKYKKIACPNCGYHGLAGVTEDWVEPYWKRVSLALLAGVPLLLLFLYEYVFQSDDVYLFDDFPMHNTVLIVVVFAALGIFFPAVLYLDRRYKICPRCKRKVK